MSNIAFSSPIPEKPTQFEQDIDHLIKQLEEEVGRLKQKHEDDPRTGISWINNENQGIPLFIQLANELLETYSYKLKENEPKNIKEAYEYLAQPADNKVSDNKNLAIELAEWITDCKKELVLAITTGKWKQVVNEIKNLKSRTQDFKHPKQPDFFKRLD